jgi:uncharacterized metal-binding protein YceD (DUF177 family)
MITKPADAPTLSRPFVVTDLGDAPKRIKIEASEAERAALAAENGLPAIASLVASFTLTHQGQTRVRVEGRVKAHLTQTCVVSLEPFDTDVEDTLEVLFAPENEVREAEEELKQYDEEIDEEDRPEPPDPIVNNRIDLGRLAAEFFVLALDPYPRKPGVAFEAPQVASDIEESPFAKLARLKQEKESGPK